jgi:hypothetical protein
VTSSHSKRRFVGAAVALSCLLGFATPAFAQISLPPKGEGSVTVVVQQGSIIYHLIPDHEFDRGSIRWNTVFVDFTYGLGKKVALTVTLPYVRSVYRGTNPHCQVDQTPCPDTAVGLDDGSYHGVVQDIRATVLYALKSRGTAITPFVGAIMPSHNYPYFNHSAAGRRLFEAEIGTGIARFLDPILPDAYLQARYSLGIPQRVLGLSHNRSTLAVEAGYMLSRSLQVFVTADGQYTHGGIDFGETPRLDNPWDVWIHHDQIGREHNLNIGAGAAVSATESLSVFASVVRSVAGHNGHKIDYLWSVGINRAFGKSSGQ